MTDTVIFSDGNIFFPFNIRTAELIASNTASETAGTLQFHRKGGGIGVAGDTVRIQRIIPVFQAGAGIQGNISLTEMMTVPSGSLSKVLPERSCR